MIKKRLAHSDLLVAPLAFGGNVLGWTVDEKTGFEILDRFVEKGFNLVDTADIYSRWASGIGGESETLIGKWIKSRKNRNHIIIASKVGMDMGNGKTGLSKKYIISAVEDSLRRLQTDHIDLYQSHQDDEKTPVIETLQAYEELIKAGKVRYIGASNFTAARLQESLDTARKFNLPMYQSLQPHYNLRRRDLFEGELQALCVKENLGVLSYFSLASGFLTGKYRKPEDNNKSVRGSSMSSLMDEKGKKLLKTLDEVSDRNNSRPATVALAWLLAQPAVTAPIASATSITQLNELMACVDLKLSAEDLAQLSAAGK